MSCRCPVGGDDLELRVILTNSSNKQTYDISELCGPITIENYINGQPGKMSFTLQKDPNDILQISNGSQISFSVDGVRVFLGYVFTMGTDATETYKITAYDQLRYFKNQEIYVIQGMTVDQIFTLLCQQVEIKHKVKVKSQFVVPKKVFEKASRYEILEYAMQKTLVGTQTPTTRGQYFFIRDDFGTLTLSELESEKSLLVLGEGSLLTDYKWEASIDKDTFNEIRVYKDDKKTGKRTSWIKQDQPNIERWGRLRYMESAADELNEAQIVELAENLLKVKNRETQTMQLNAIGYPNINAGSGFVLDIARLNIKQYMWVTSASHVYRKDFHSMSLQVFV